MENRSEEITYQADDLPNQEREDQILGGAKALVTILKLSIAPFFSQITNSMYGFVNTLWLGKTVSTDATAALATATTIDSLAISCGFYLSTCTSSKIAALFGEKRPEVAGQIISDAVRFSFIIGIILPAVLLPVAPHLMAWFGSSPYIVDLGFEYIVPVMACSTITCIYLMLCGCLQAEGRIIIFAFAQISSMVLNAGVFNPLFLLGAKVGISGSAASIVLSQAVPCIALIACYYSGCFTVKPNWRDLLKKPSPEFPGTLKIGLSSLVGAVSATLPSIFFQKFIGSSCNSDDEYKVMMNLYNAYNRIYQIAVAVYMALSTGFLSTSSYAFAAGRLRRCLFLLMHTTWVTTLISLILEFIIFTFPDAIASLFSSDPFFVQRFKECRIPYWTTNFLCCWQYVITPFLQSTNHPIWALVGSFVTQLLMWPMFSCVFYFTDQHNVVRLFYAVMSNDVASVLFLIPFLVLAVIGLLKPAQPTEVGEDKNNDEPEEQSVPAEL